MILVTLEKCQASLPWEKWSWAMPQAPIEHFFRRSQNVIPTKYPEYQCECPPHKECKVEFKLNEDMVEFLHLRGVYKEEDVKKFNDSLQKSTTKEAGPFNLIESRRQIPDECCCPPRNVMMPTFITENKFNEVVKRIEDQDSPKPAQ